MIAISKHFMSAHYIFVGTMIEHPKQNVLMQSIKMGKSTDHRIWYVLCFSIRNYHTTQKRHFYAIIWIHNGKIARKMNKWHGLRSTAFWLNISNQSRKANIEESSLRSDFMLTYHLICSCSIFLYASILMCYDLKLVYLLMHVT